MKPTSRSLILQVSLAGISLAMLGQRSATLNGRERRPCSEALTDQQSLYTAGRPFVATLTSTTIQKGEDGADLSPVVSPPIKVARDSSGKVYVESFHHTEKGLIDRDFSLHDPVSGTTYMWSEEDKLVAVFHSPGISSREMQERVREWPWMKRLWAVPLCAALGSGSTVDEAKFSIQDLGTSRILGMDAEGVLAVRKDDPITEERWYSPDLQIALITRVHDMRFGTFVRELKSLEQIEPDQSLFRIPAYPLVDATARQDESP